MTLKLFQILLGLRGGDRVISFLAKHLKFLQCVAIQVSTLRVFMDLRLPTCRDWLTHNLNSWEQPERNAMRHFVPRGGVAFDIGANIGLHTAFLSALVGQQGQVYAFEPNPLLHGPLRKTCESLSNVQLLPIALSNETGIANFYVPNDHTMASLRDWTAQPTKVVSVQTVPLDDLNLPTPAFIKCDVEGAELAVFRGARKTLSTAPVVLFEVNEHTAKGFNQSSTAAHDFLATLGVYDFYEVKESLGTSTAVFNGNVLAVPREMAGLESELAQGLRPFSDPTAGSGSRRELN